MTGWHADEKLLSDYTNGLTDYVLSGSIETHLMGCATCRSMLRHAVDTRRIVYYLSGTAFFLLPIISIYFASGCSPAPSTGSTPRGAASSSVPSLGSASVPTQHDCWWPRRCCVRPGSLRWRWCSPSPRSPRGPILAV